MIQLNHFDAFIIKRVKTLIDIINALDCSADELLCIEIKKAKPVFDSWMVQVPSVQ